MPEPTIDERVRELREYELRSRINPSNWARKLEARDNYQSKCAEHMPAILDALAEAQRRVAALEGDMNPQDVQEAYAREGIE